MHKLLTLGLASLFLVVTGCQDTNTTGPLVGPSFHEGGVDDDGVLSVEGEGDDDDEGREVEAGGEEIIRPLFGNPFTTLNYSFEVESEDGEVEGEISGRGEGPGGIFGESRGIVTCITVEPDGVTARMGGLITQSESNISPDLTGQQAVWTVVAGEDGSAQSTFVFISGDFETLAQFHCDVGIPPGALGGLVSISADIEVEVD